jgi:hypothetical protein
MHGLGMADVQETVGLRRETGDHLFEPARLHVLGHRLADEIYRNFLFPR